MSDENALDHYCEFHRHGFLHRCVPLSAFSLMEMVITLLVMSICAAVAVPRWADASERRRIKSAASVIEADLRAALRTAAIRAQTITVTPTINSGAMTISPALSSTGAVASDVIDYSQRFTGLRFTQANFDGASSCKVDIYQRWVNAQTGQPLAVATLEVQVGSKRLTINLLSLLRSSSASSAVAMLPGTGAVL